MLIPAVVFGAKGEARSDLRVFETCAARLPLASIRQIAAFDIATVESRNNGGELGTRDSRRPVLAQ